MKSVLSIASSFLFLAMPFCHADPVNDRPNVILLVVDDMGWTDLGCYGSDFHQTPNIDKLASQGMLFLDAYSSSAVCSPTRASLMTGKYPARLHITAITDGGNNPKFNRYVPPTHKKYLDPDEFTLAEALRSEGYRTVHLGKWHLGKEEIYWPENQGFDVNIGGWRPGMPIIAEGKSNGYFSPYGNPRLSDGPDGEYLTERLTDEAVRVLQDLALADQPFFLNFWYYTVHLPLQAVPEKVEYYSDRVDPGNNHTNPVYAAMVEHLDESVGRVMKAVSELGLDRNTVVILTSDNGGSLGGTERSPERITSNAPLRSGKGDMFEGGVRVPFIVRWTDQIEPSTTNRTPVISCDLYPTILGLTRTQGDPSHNENFDGVDLSSLFLHGEPLPERSLYWHYPHYSRFGSKPFSAIRKGDWKLVEVFEREELMLFDLQDDIGEQRNLFSRFPEVARKLQQELRQWRSNVRAQMPLRNPDYNPELSDG